MKTVTLFNMPVEVIPAIEKKLKQLMTEAIEKDDYKTLYELTYSMDEIANAKEKIAEEE